ncbi:hypothetical protein [Flavihumibacter fluvii]|uniref:hypothetical protein n=1 Tax=Flavihumibacter fluvii TaxID=2838157 RepID=UPI001BDDCC75|nr:hypothetical protein [Flavihumibacter fluvii]ULQ54370.1 hypothetical protein KJS93_08575 [Flavihumibacter fluvii]
MQLHFAIQHVLGQLSATILLLNEQQFSQPCKNLSNATIGQHTRHIIEMFQCLLAGYADGIVNYEKRPRNRRIETDRSFTLSIMKTLFSDLARPNKTLVLEATYLDENDLAIALDTNFFREIAYNLEHAIHHMALIKVGILEVTDLELPEGFGVAPSTQKFKKACAQ